MLIVPHICLKCRSELSRRPLAMECSACGTHWPIINGIPSYDSAKYFGEISCEEMEKVVLSAEKGHWLTACAHFKGDHNYMYQYIADLNRASWIPLLPLGPESTVLDVGSGWGAVTHALALAFERVVSIEPVIERARFTKARIEQEGLENVEIVQTTVTNLPFFDNTFDLIVLNGILEWVGEWKTDISPREGQIYVLKCLRDKLKPNGVLLIGIENRIGWGSFLGQVDHSGMPFTNIMPRWLASLFLRWRNPKFYRTSINPRKGYRTYTYTQRGYLKLMREAGFNDLEFWWPKDYNMPTQMIRITEHEEVKSWFLRDRSYKQRVHGHTFRRGLKHWLLVKSGMIFSMFPSFVILAKKGRAYRPMARNLNTSVLDMIYSELAKRQPSNAIYSTLSYKLMVSMLRCHSFKNKQVLKIVDQTGRMVAVAKLANVRRKDYQKVERAFRNLDLVRNMLLKSKSDSTKSVPDPISIFRIRNTVVALESPVNGVSLQDLSTQPGYFKDRERVKGHLDLLVTWFINFQLQGKIGSTPYELMNIPDSWLQLKSEGMGELPCPKETWKNQSHYQWIQHGDFISDNIFIHEPSERIAVVDWDDLAIGYPPLFDFFCAVTSLYYYPEEARIPKGQTADLLSFIHTYFKKNWFSDLVLHASFRICEALGLSHADMVRYFRECFAVRYYQFIKRTYSTNEGPVSQFYQECYEMVRTEQEKTIFHHV